MSKPKAVTGKQLIKALAHEGFIIISQRSSHYRLMNPADGRKVTIAFHHNETIKAGTLSGILRDLGLSKAELQAMLKR